MPMSFDKHILVSNCGACVQQVTQLRVGVSCDVVR